MYEFVGTSFATSSVAPPPAKSPSESDRISHESDFESTSAVVVKFEEMDD